MPAVSRAQQRLMAAAEHGANFPMAQKLRDSMSHSQLHDYASGSEEGKPERVHPAVAKHHQMISEAHDHLAQSIPGFEDLPHHQQMIAHHTHVEQRIKNGHGL